MKNLICILLICLPIVSFGQDKIYFTDGSVVKAKVSLIDLQEIRFKKFNNLQGPDYVLKKYRIKRIEYENGTVDYFEESPPDTAQVADRIQDEYYTDNHYEEANKAPEEPNIRIRNPNGMSVVLLGPSLIGAGQYDYFVSPNFNIEIGIGLVGIYGGVTYHFDGKNPARRSTPYVGLRGTLGLIAAEFINFGPRFGRGVMLPFGFDVNTKGGFYIRPEISAWYTYSTMNWQWTPRHAVRPWVSLPIGWRF